jgi:hypothetical protein
MHARSDLDKNPILPPISAFPVTLLSRWGAIISTTTFHRLALGLIISLYCDECINFTTGSLLPNSPVSALPEMRQVEDPEFVLIRIE